MTRTEGGWSSRSYPTTIIRRLLVPSPKPRQPVTYTGAALVPTRADRKGHSAKRAGSPKLAAVSRRAISRQSRVVDVGRAPYAEREPLSARGPEGNLARGENERHRLRQPGQQPSP